MARVYIITEAEMQGLLDQLQLQTMKDLNILIHPNEYEKLQPDEKNGELKQLRDGWYVEARKQRLETLPAFLDALTKHDHDYNTIVYACGAAALAAVAALDHSPKGGITGFQAGAVMWEFITEFLHMQDQPLSLVKYENMLYPQYAHKFDKTIEQSTADWLKERAAKMLAEVSDDSEMHPAVREHLEKLAAGELPFGYRIAA